MFSVPSLESIIDAPCVAALSGIVEAEDEDGGGEASDIEAIVSVSSPAT